MVSGHVEDRREDDEPDDVGRYVDDDRPPPCSIARALEIVGDAWTMLVLRDIFRGTRRFDDIRRDLGISRPVLTDRLKRLTEAGVLRREQYNDRPPRFEYRLTAMGRDLSPALVALMHWGDTHLADDGPPVVLVHDACGHELDQRFVCHRCDETFTPTHIASRPGPGASAGRSAIDTTGDTPGHTGRDHGAVDATAADHTERGDRHARTRRRH